MQTKEARREAATARAESLAGVSDKDRLASLKSRGHGTCLEAILLEPSQKEKMDKLAMYIEFRPEGASRRRAQRELAKMEKAR